MPTNALTRRSVLGGAAALALPSLIGRASGQEAVDLAPPRRRPGWSTLGAPGRHTRIATAFQAKYDIPVELFHRRRAGAAALPVGLDAKRPGADAGVIDLPTHTRPDEQK
jgi:hypothetical protein